MDSAADKFKVGTGRDFSFDRTRLNLTSLREIIRNPRKRCSQPGQSLGRTQFTLQMPLEGLEGESPQIVAASSRKRLAGKCRRRGAEHPLRQLPGVRGEQVWTPVSMKGAEQAIRHRIETGLTRDQGRAASGAVTDVGKQTHQACHP